MNLLLNVDKGAQQDRIYGGVQPLAEKIAEEFFDQIKFSTPVDKVEQDDEKVVVYSNGQSWTASHLIMAIPPVLSRKIDFSPELPENRTRLLNHYFMGSVVKCYAIYEEPFWRKDNLSGLVASNAGYISVCFDNSPRDAEKGMIMAFVLANKAKEFGQFSEEKRKEIILTELTEIFGLEAKNATTYIDKVWADETYSGGCYAGMLPPQSWTEVKDHLRFPTGRIHWAGTETATEWNGYIEGAVRAGKRAAKEVI